MLSWSGMLFAQKLDFAFQVKSFGGRQVFVATMTTTVRHVPLEDGELQWPTIQRCFCSSGRCAWATEAAHEARHRQVSEIRHLGCRGAVGGQRAPHGLLQDFVSGFDRWGVLFHQRLHFIQQSKPRGPWTGLSSEASSFIGGSSSTSCSATRSRTSGSEPREPGPGRQEVRLAVHPLLRKAKFLAVLADKLRGFVRARGGGGRCQWCLCPLVGNSTVYHRSLVGSARRIPPKVLYTKCFSVLSVKKQVPAPVGTTKCFKC